MLLFVTAASCADASQDSEASSQHSDRAALFGDFSGTTVWLLPEDIDGRSDLALRVNGVIDGQDLDWCAARVRGEQWLLEVAPRSSDEVGIALATALGARRGSAVFSVTAVDTHDDRGRRIVRSAKACHYSRGGSPLESEASPAACARFGVPFEIVPMRDPTHEEIGSALPLRLRFDQGASSSIVDADSRDWVERARVSVRHEATTSQVAHELKPQSAAFVDVPIERSGLYCIEARLDFADASFVSTLTFRIGARD
ncbi:MAG TPA: hypothetical protein PKE00_01765 [Planctomycetota bacterium]|nr:hypothetical protein [Planctomycetota bacterium]